MVAGLYIGNVYAHRLDHRGAFMPEHRGRRIRIQAFHEMQVGVT
jgi:hypothetical protein